MIRISVLSNICFEPYLKKSFLRAFSGTADVSYTSLNDIGEATVLDAELILLHINLEDWLNSADMLQTEDIIVRCREMYNCIRNKTNAVILFLGFEDYFSDCHYVYGNITPYNGIADRLNIDISEDIFDIDSFIDLKRIIARIGIEHSYSVKGKYRWNSPYSEMLTDKIADEVYKQYCIITGQTKKCLVLDCDNVLWGGILSEDGIEGIRLGNSGLGREYRDFQRFLQDLYFHGVILTVCSKNDEPDVRRVFREHSGMILREEQVACFKINWNSKPENIRAIADELNISTDSMVFVDDSVFETEAVRALLPEVITIKYDRERMYEKFASFNLRNNMDSFEVEARNRTYRTAPLRKALMEKCGSYDKYIESLDSRIDIHRILPAEYSRVAELTRRTNRCTNGMRYTAAEIKRHAQEQVWFYTVSLSDRFSDLGIVGAIETEDNVLRLFSLSCRALGRGVEEKMLRYIAAEHDIKTILFSDSGKNQSLFNLLNDIFPNAEFVCVDDGKCRSGDAK